LTGFSSTPTPNQPLGEEEQQVIVDVIQRAEKIDLTEQERVSDDFCSIFKLVIVNPHVQHLCNL